MDAKVAALVKALKQIAGDRLVTETISGAIPAIIDGRETTITYTRSKSNRRVASDALAEWERRS